MIYSIVEGDEASSRAENYFIPELIYSVILCKDLGGYELGQAGQPVIIIIILTTLFLLSLVLMHNPWNDPNYLWAGEWSDQSNDWELYPEMLVCYPNPDYIFGPKYALYMAA